MAKKSMIARDTKRTKINKKDHAKRLQLKAVIASADVSYDERWDAMIALQKLPRDGSKSRQRNRCAMTGRPHGNK